MDSQVTLRPVAESDLGLLVQLFTDPAVVGESEWYGWQDGRWLRHRWDENGLLGDDGGTLLVDHAGETVGLVNWRKRPTGFRSWCWAIGVTLVPEARGHGYGTQVQRGLVHYLFAHTQAVRIEAETDVTNAAEQRALEKAGFTREGILRSVVFRAGQWRDAVLYSILRGDAALDSPTTESSGQGVRGDTAVVDEPALTFAGLLRRLRAETRLTQEELAEAAGVSPRSVSDLERGINRTARKETAVLLARALGLPGAVAELFVAAARGRGLAEDVMAARQGTALGAFAAAATRGLPRDLASFTGRQAELDRLAEGLDGLAAGGGVVGICAIGGMAGVGKTTFAVHAAHRLAGSFPDGQFYLPLHGHTRGQRPVDPADALSSLLLTAGVPAT